MPIRCLSIHARYLCAHAGACCRTGWPIPVEEPLVQPLRALGFRIDDDRLAPRTSDGQCAFFEADAGRLCAIHRRGGASLLPSVCRHFPRVIVNDPRGASVTLSHFCPTAANLLFERAPLTIVEAPASLTLDGTLEGLDATSVLPPLLSGGVLTDWEGYSTWEEHAVALFNRVDLEPEDAVDQLACATDAACSWRPGGEPLTDAVRQGFSEATAAAPVDGRDWGGYRRAVNAFLAAHAFASWAAYERDGLRAIPRAVAQALATLTAKVAQQGTVTQERLTDAIRATDLRLRHSR